MSPKSPVELADKFSRKRAWLVGAVAIVFALNVLGRMWLGYFDEPARTRFDWWAINAIVLLLLLATGGGLLLRRSVRRLMNDEVARAHLTTALVSAFWVSMVAAMTIYVWPGFRSLPGPAVIRVIVSAGISIALLVFAILEIRAHRDA